MNSRGLSLPIKIFLGTALVVVFVVGLVYYVTSRSANTAADASVNRTLSSAREAVTAQLTGRATSMREAAEVFAGNARFRAVVEKDPTRDNMLDQASVAAGELRATWAQIVDADGTRLAKSDDPAADTISLAGSPLVGAALEANATTAFGVTGDTVLTMFAAVPIEGGGTGTVIGALMAAHALDSAFAAEVKSRAGSDVDLVFYYLDTLDVPHISGSTLGRDAEVDGVLGRAHAMVSREGATGDNTMADSATGAAPENERVDAEIGGTHFVGLASLVTSAGGTPVGGYLMLRDRTAEFAAFTKLSDSLLWAGGLGILVAGLLSALLARQITRPISKLVAATKRATDGDYDAEISSTSNDEIGALALAFRGMLGDLREKQQLVDFLSTASGARTVQVQAMSDTAAQRMSEGGLQPGSTFAGRYEVKEVLGVGGMGMVFKARDRELGEVIAIKTLKGDFLREDPSALERFKSEIRLARRISHRNVVRTHDLGEVSGVYYITMEFVEGTSLKDLIRSRGRLPIGITLSVGKQLARALEIAHEQGIIHRDVKPQNMVVEPTGVLKVMDFGIARMVKRPEQSGHTQAGMIVGTPEYMAPEQLVGDGVDHRVDIYAAGCVLYECLTGRPPFTAETPYQLIAKLLEEVPETPRSLNGEVPAGLDTLVMRTLAKEAAGRPQTAAALHDALALIG